ncbi:MAG: 2-hydroxyacyl-CoA dehydratase subunit D [Moorellaceae bacterium]
MEKTGSNLIGWLCSYTPVEIIRALKLTPYRLLPPPGKTPRADTYFTGNVCPYVKAVLENALEGRYPPLAGVLFVASCNAMIHLSHIWRHLHLSEKVFTLDVPRRSDALAIRYWTERLKELAAELAGCFNRSIEEETLWSAIEEESRRRYGWEKLLEERAAGRLLVKGQELLLSLNYGLNSGALNLQEEVGATALSDGLSRPRLLLIGSVLPGSLLEMVEEAGMVSVYEDACNFWRLEGVGAGGREEKASDPYAYLAKAYLHKPPCPRMVGDQDRRRAYLREIVSKYRIEGAVYHAMKFCDAAMVDFALVKMELEELGIPLLKLEGDYTGGNRGQWTTRIEAFREML